MPNSGGHKFSGIDARCRAKRCSNKLLSDSGGADPTLSHPRHRGLNGGLPAHWPGSGKHPASKPFFTGWRTVRESSGRCAEI
eukprot:93130-Pyramimonas_sp.AAC.1